jgi:hypothetical protein
VGNSPRPAKANAKRESQYEKVTDGQAQTTLVNDEEPKARFKINDFNHPVKKLPVKELDNEESKG